MSRSDVPVCCLENAPWRFCPWCGKSIPAMVECSAPDCRQMFQKKTKGVFCSQRCQSRTYMRQYRRSTLDVVATNSCKATIEKTD